MMQKGQRPREEQEHGTSFAVNYPRHKQIEMKISKGFIVRNKPGKALTCSPKKQKENMDHLRVENR